MNTEAMHKALEDSQAGKLTFPEVVGMLTNAGVESYFADLIRGEETFYTVDDETHRERMTLPLSKIAGDFSQHGVVAAIRAAQADQNPLPGICEPGHGGRNRCILGFPDWQKSGLLRPQRRVSRGRISAPEIVRSPQIVPEA